MRKLVSVIVGLIVLTIAAANVSAAEYEVKKGDSLWKIANEHNITVEQLMEMNDLKSTLIHPKQILKVDEEESDGGKAEIYIVQQGDTLTHISEALGDEVTVEKLKAWNHLTSDLIITGQQLNVNGEGVKAPPSPAQTVTTEKPTAAANVTASEKTEEKQVTPAQQSEETTTETEVEPATESAASPQGRTFTVEATAYTAGCTGCSGITATGINLNANPHAKVIAVDPNVIPLGTQVYVEGYGYAVAGDTGGAIKGKKIDIHVPTKQEAYNWGRRTVSVTIVD